MKTLNSIPKTVTFHYSQLLSIVRRVFVVVAALYGSAHFAEEPIILKDLDSNDGVFESGTLLMELPLGIHRLEQESKDTTKLLIAVHGYGSRGYEWVYPMQTLDDEETETFFFRWDYSKCADESADLLIEEIDQLMTSKSELEHITVIGHSLGGVLVSMLVGRWSTEVSSDLHTVAAPLAGTPSMSDECASILPERIPNTVRFFQWRTRHKLDNAFNQLDVDPQIVQIDGSVAVTLPETYRDRRLGHNWSISWVADRLAKAKQDDEDQ